MTGKLSNNTQTQIYFIMAISTHGLFCAQNFHELRIYSGNRFGYTSKFLLLQHTCIDGWLATNNMGPKRSNAGVGELGIRVAQVATIRRGGVDKVPFLILSNTKST